MSTIEKSHKGGSFGDLRSRHLPIFDKAVQRHDRGWPHEPATDKTERTVSGGRWRTAGIFHFRSADDNES